ncbi:MAG: M6 family metalloprotease domain-containing protein [Prevotellaceae bacterium]|jgi:M6 family metalloprotease-like protein|nr:M6 family metalloprotease domain-containing protein [Prevotellaceae bacterium]
MKKIILLIVLFLPFFAQVSFAVLAYPYPVTVTQADGSQLTIQLHGHEFFNYATTVDGYLLVANEQGSYEYAMCKDDGEFQRLGVIARDVRTKEELDLIKTLQPNTVFSKKEAFVRKSRQAKIDLTKRIVHKPLFGNSKGVVILVNFSDKAFSVANPREAFHDMLNKPNYSANGATGSAADYFAASSNGAFTPVFDVAGPYTLPENMAYYGRNNDRGDVNPGRMITDACSLANADINFADYDSDNDDAVDNVFVFYAGYNEAEGGGDNTIWPHRSVVNNSPTLDGKKIYDYACSSELRSNYGTMMAGIGTFCHEFGHVLGLPDFYPTNGANHYTIGKWDIMANGSYNNDGKTPPSYSSHERFYLTYLTPTILSTGDKYVLEPLTTHNTAYILTATETHNLIGNSPNPSEYFMIENRQAVGWDSIGLPGTGMLISRVAYNAQQWADNSPNNTEGSLLMDIMEADGHPTYSSNRDTYPGSRNVTSFTPKLLNSTTLTSSPILSIEQQGNSILFCYKSCGSDGPYLKLLPQKDILRTEVGVPVTNTIGVSGGKLTDPVVLTLTGTDRGKFQMRLTDDVSDQWRSTLTITPVDSIVSASVDVRYNPDKPSFYDKHNARLEARSGTSAIHTIDLVGQSTQRMTMGIPDTLHATRISPYAFQANWKREADAVGYYVTVYTKDGASTDTQNFSQLGVEVAPDWQWNFITESTNNPASAPKAALFTSVLDTIWSAHYPEAVTHIKFWARNENLTQTGAFSIDGFNGTAWQKIATIPINKNMTGSFREYSLNAADNYRQFRFSCDSVSTRGMAFDDFSVTYPLSILKKSILTHIDENAEPTEHDSLRITGLTPNKDYYYRVQATDQDPRGQYENVTDFSLEVPVTTPNGEEADSRVITATFDENGNVHIALNDLDLRDADGNKQDLYIFSTDGRMIKTIPHTDFAADPGNIVISGLSPQNVYIISLGAQRKGKYVKIFQPKQ